MNKTPKHGDLELQVMRDVRDMLNDPDFDPGYLASFDGERWTDERDAEAWKRVEELSEEAIGMCYDDCHKIYLLMDHAAVEDMLGHGYAIIAPSMTVLKEWYEEDSCQLRFINFIQGEVIEDVIPQLMWTREEAK